MKCLQILFLLAILFQCLESLKESAESVLFKCEVVDRKTRETVPLTETFTLKLRENNLKYFDEKFAKFLTLSKSKDCLKEWLTLLVHNENYFIRAIGSMKNQGPCRFDLSRRHLLKFVHPLQPMFTDRFFFNCINLIKYLWPYLGMYSANIYFCYICISFLKAQMRPKERSTEHLPRLVSAILFLFLLPNKYH
jgi:hypothetical protein